jgi:hypothetical protein
MFDKLPTSVTSFSSSQLQIVLILTLGVLGLFGIMGVQGKLLAAVSDPISGPVSPSPSATTTASPSATPSISPSSSPSATASPSASPSIAPSPSASASASPTPAGQVINFNDFSGQNTPINGQYPSGVIDWRQNNWMVAGPIGEFDSKSVRFREGFERSQTFSFVSPQTVLGVDVLNEGNFPSAVYLSCRTQGPPFFNFELEIVQPGEVETINTGWSAPCRTVKVFASRGGQTYFDNLVVK